MPTKITVIFDNPADPDLFEAGYQRSLSLAQAIPEIEPDLSSQMAA